MSVGGLSTWQSTVSCLPLPIGFIRVPTRPPSLSSVVTHCARYATACFLKASLYPSTLTPSRPWRSWSTTRLRYGKKEGRLILLGGPLLTCVWYSSSSRLQSQTGQHRVRTQPYRAVYLQRWGRGRMPNRTLCADLPCGTVYVATCVSTLALIATFPGCINLGLLLKCFARGGVS